MSLDGSKWLSLSTAGTDLVACTLVGLLLGWSANKWFPGSRPWGFLICLLLGIAAGFWQLFKRAAPQRKGRP